ncbi:S-locus receptor kinase (SRK) [Zostera marina]|uniref:Receptor-like serine/threonine-protein kinase n=1 Tax=Zostera marina TaxID=29655 RepID=A0A0K9PKC6_ZOSMR|nr:S-locus receptor kinase (SRK) [Zostera marina]
MDFLLHHLMMSSSSFLILLFLISHGFQYGEGQIGRGSIATDYNFTGTGIFLNSPHSTFHAAICNPGNQTSRYYLCVVHKQTDTILWSANPSSPITSSSSSLLTLSVSGLTITNASHSVVWSTAGAFNGSVSALRLLDSGNLQLIDKFNVSLWTTFDYPTDTFVSGQRISVGGFLTSFVSESDLMPGDYKMVVTETDATLQWRAGQKYWALSSDLQSAKDSNNRVSYMVMNNTGLYLLGSNSQVVITVPLSPPAILRFGKLAIDGRFRITSYAQDPENSTNNTFIAPTKSCDLPFSCGSVRTCILKGSDTNFICNCPSGFRHSDDPEKEVKPCVPSDESSLASSTSFASSTSSFNYLRLPKGVGYFANKFTSPAFSDSNFSNCQLLCSGNCTCLGFYYINSSRSCYFLENDLGSTFSGADEEDIGYIKTISGKPPSTTHASSNRSNILPIVLPSVALALLLIVIFLYVALSRRKSRKDVILGRKGRQRAGFYAATEEEIDEDESDLSIPGLPTRFTFRELEEATDGFKTCIGSGGFGEVYKGTLLDGTVVAVKRISNISIQGKKEFLTEISVIGRIHHINLVNLRGFCNKGTRCLLLVYDFMNRGSLDKSLFAPYIGRTEALEGPPQVLEWRERMEIALSAARGLAYLHVSCENTIIHCDIKPENILLHDHNGVKISDFGLAKFLSPEQPNLITTMRGTRGYLAPEWLTNASISDRTDVYSFGMVLLEIVHGRKNCVSLPSSEMSEVESYFPVVALDKYEKGKCDELADPRLERRVPAVEVKEMVKLSLCCLHEEPRLRPSMVAVVGMLEGRLPVSKPRVELLKFLKMYSREVVETEGERGVGVGNSGNGSVSYQSPVHVSGIR